MTDTPRTKAVYQQIYDGCASSADSIVRMTKHAEALEREIAWQRERADALLNQVNHWKDFAQRLTGVDANDHGWLRAELESQWRKKEGEPRVEARPRDGICKGCGKFVAFQDICARDERTGHNDYHVECVPK